MCSSQYKDIGSISCTRQQDFVENIPISRPELGFVKEQINNVQYEPSRERVSKLRQTWLLTLADVQEKKMGAIYDFIELFFGFRVGL